jgi:hypothetical protein
MALPLIELLLVLSIPLPLPLLEEEDFPDFESDVLADVFEPDLAFVPEVLLSEEEDLLLLDLPDGDELEEESELLPEPPAFDLLPRPPWFDEFMSELPMPELPMLELPDEDCPPDILPDWLED